MVLTARNVSPAVQHVQELHKTFAHLVALIYISSKVNVLVDAHLNTTLTTRIWPALSVKPHALHAMGHQPVNRAMPVFSSSKSLELAFQPARTVTMATH